MVLDPYKELHEQEKIIEQLQEENLRYRKALEEIADFELTILDNASVDIAKQALKGE